jgi:hypothetical protein
MTCHGNPSINDQKRIVVFVQSFRHACQICMKLVFSPRIFEYQF